MYYGGNVIAFIAADFSLETYFNDNGGFKTFLKINSLKVSSSLP
jgi:hypothetical protein